MIYLALIVATMWALYPFLVRRADAHFMTIWVWMNGIAAVVGILVCLVCKKPLKLPGGKTTWMVLLASILGPIGGALLYFWLLKNAKHATPVIALAYTTPAIAAILGCYLFKEHRISLVQMVGIIMVCMGVVLVSLREK